jgi:ADP-ribose pyrophosphatase
VTASYEVTARVERIRNKVFTVVTDQVRMPDGEVVARDYVLHIGAVAVVALDNDDRMLLVRQYRHPVGRSLWEVPAGLIDAPGEPLADAAARELAEEADLTASSWALLADAYTSPGYSNERIRIFLARGIGQVPEIDRHTRTHEEAGLTTSWVPLDEAVGMALSGEVTNAICMIGILAAAQAKARNWSTLRPVSGAG